MTSLCIAAAVPPTTALRWIKVMTEKGWLWSKSFMPSPWLEKLT